MKRTYRLLYRLGTLPWQHTDIPTTVQDLVVGPAALPAGRAVDLGCGTGEQARYLAAHGWQVTAVDYIPAAITAARCLDPDGTVDWLVADVTRAEEITSGRRMAAAVGLILDNGCLHGIAATDRPGWAHTVDTLAAPGATLLVRAAPARRASIAVPAGINRDDLTALLANNWRPADPPATSPHSTWHRYTHL